MSYLRRVMQSGIIVIIVPFVDAAAAAECLHASCHLCVRVYIFVIYSIIILLCFMQCGELSSVSFCMFV